MRRPGLRLRLTSWFAGCVLLILAVCAGGLLLLQWRAMRASLDHHLSEDLEVVAEMVAFDGAGFHWRTESVRDLGYDAGPQRWAEVTRRAGGGEYLRGLPATNPGIRATLPAPSASALGWRTARTPAGAFVRMLTEERRIDGEPAVIRVVRTEDPLREEFRRLVLVFALGTPLAVLAAALSGYLIAGRALAPIATMADRARSISADRLSERLPIDNPHDELGQLATVFNETFARLETSFEQLKRFSADASHELRTPLTAIRSVGEVGLRQPRTAEGYQEIIGSMLEEADRLARLVDTLLTLSRWESGRVRPVALPFDLREVARDVVEQLGVLAEDRGLSVSCHLAAPLPVRGDEIILRQALVNVVDNAIKFTAPGGAITVTGLHQAGECRIVVDDSGPGIPEGERERVTERFYRVAASGERPGGSGLGLALVKWAVTAHHGRLEIAASPSSGARVVLVLPAA